MITLKKITFLIIVLLLPIFTIFAQTNIYGPISFGSGATSSSGQGDDLNIYVTGWTSDPPHTGGSLTSGGWGASSASASSGYSGASGSNNAIVENRVIGTYPVGSHLITPSINTANYTNIELKFGRRFSGTSGNPITVTISYSTDGGTSFITTGLNNNVLVWENSNWALHTVTGLPSTSDLKIRWTASGSGSPGLQNFRIDDVSLIGIPLSVNDGDGTATLVNDGTGTLNGSPIFSRNSSGQTVKVTVTGVQAGLLDKVRLTVPTDFTGFNGSNVTLGGAFAGKSTSIVGNQITVLNAALGTTPGTITISNLTSPNPVGASLNGNSTWLVETAIAGGTLTPIAVSPKSYTIIPISNIKTGGVDGYGNSDAGNTPVMNGEVVAVSGVATIEHAVLNTSSYTSFYIQEGTYGLQVFRNAAPVVTWVRGDQLILRGTIGQFNGGMQIVPLSGASPDFFNLGAGTMPSPLVLTNASDITEQYEGRLIQLNNAFFDSAGQTFIGSAVNRGMNNFRTSPVDTGTLFIHGSNTAVVGKTIPVSANIVGVVHQRNDIIGAGQTRYKIAIRNMADLGLNPADGSGTATISPTQQIIGSTGLSQTIVLKGDGTNTIEGMSLTIPSSWTWTGNPAHAEVSGPGFASASKAVSGDGSSGNPWVITITGAAVTNVDTGIVTITNLTAPSSTGSTTFFVKTRGIGGTFNAIGVQPTVTIIAPPATLPFVEIFDYPAGEKLTDYGWTAHSGAGTNSIRVNENPLTYSGYIHSGVGKSVTLTTTGEDVSRGFESVNSGSIYASFMVRFDTALATPDYFFHFSPSGATTPHYARIYFKKDVSGNVALGVTKGGSPDTGWVPFSLTMGNTYLIVMKYTFNTGSNTDDEIKLWINPDLSGIEPTADVTYTTSLPTDPSNFGTVALRQGSGNARPAVTLGGLRIATDWIPASSTSMNIVYSQGWNMVSVPVIVPDFRKSVVFPTAVSAAFTFDNGYITKDTLKNGVGYWLKFGVSQTVSMNGVPRITDSVTVKAGWNMIGTLSVPVLVSQVVPSSGVTIISQFYGFINGYQVVDTLKPGRAYWVKVSADGKLYLNVTNKYSKHNSDLLNKLNNFNTITIRDAVGYSQTLYFGSDEQLNAMIDYFELPPTAPSGIFDVRYQTNRLVAICSENLNSLELYPISISSAVYPISIEWNIKNANGVVYELDGIIEGNIENSVQLISNGNIQVKDDRVNQLMLKVSGKASIPKEFGLSQNYPNPFNPSTKMMISLPKDSYVKLAIYDILGREVGLVVDKFIKAGNHSVELNVNSQGFLTSGVYFVKMSAKSVENDNFDFVRKITILK